MRIAALFFFVPMFGFYKNYMPRFTRCLVPQTKILHIRTFNVGIPPKAKRLSDYRKCEIQQTVNLMSLFAIHEIHHMKPEDLHRYYNLDLLEKEYMKECVGKRYKSHQTYLEAVYGTL